MVKGSKTQKIMLDKQGSYLGMEKGCFTVKDKTGNVKHYPLFEKEIGEKQGRYYNIPQVKIIFEKLSLPSEVAA